MLNKTLNFLIIIFSIWLISCGDNNNSSNLCEPNPCESSLIPHKTECKLLGDNDFECICESGYFTDNGSCKKEEVNPCEPNPCTEDNKIICIANSQTENDYACECDEGFFENEEANTCDKVVKCEEDSCTEDNKTVCSVMGSGSSARIICDCDDKYEEDINGICRKIESFNLRLMAANITSGNDQSYDASEGIRIFQGIKPDVIMIQEMNYRNNSKSDYEILAGKVFNDANCIAEKRCYYYAGVGQIPNGILSKYRILARGYWDDPEISNRDLNYAIVDLPGDKDLFVISVHLSTKGSKQLRPAAIIAHNVAEHKAANPNKFYYAVGGDFNGSTAVSTSGFGKEDAFNIDDPFPKSESGNYDTNASRAKHYDWLLASSELSAKQISSDFCSETDETDCKRYKDGLVMDTREYVNSPTDMDKYFSPAELGDSGAINMQHMAIIKDFLITF